MTLDIFKCGSSQNNTHIDQYVIAYFRGLTNNDTHAMIDDDPATNSCSGMDFDASEKPADMGKETCG